MPSTGNIISALNRLVRVSRQMLQELGREPTAEELAERLAKPVEQVRKLMAIAGLPLSLEAPAGAA